MLNLKQSVAFVSFLIVVGCKPLLVSYKTVPPQIPIKDSTKSILLVEADHVQTPGIAVTKKREQVVTDISKNYLPQLQEQLGQRIPIHAKIADSISSITIDQLLQHDENTIARLLKQYNASIIIVLKIYNAGFTQDRIEKTQTSSGGTEKIAYYSVLFETGASIYQNNEWYDKVIQVHRPHSSRSVISGLLARGPGYEANKKDIEQMMSENIVKLCELFLSTRETVYSRQ